MMIIKMMKLLLEFKQICEQEKKKLILQVLFTVDTVFVVLIY